MRHQALQARHNPLPDVLGEDTLSAQSAAADEGLFDREVQEDDLRGAVALLHAHFNVIEAVFY